MVRFRSLIFEAILVFCLSALLLTGCASIPAPSRSDRIGETGSLGECAEFFASLDEQTKKANALDPGVFRVKKYPYLRADRFIASFRQEIDTQAAFAAWLDRMQALDQDARNHEIANLPDSAVTSLDPEKGRAELRHKVVTCGDQLRAADFLIVNHQEKLNDNLSVFDDYITLRRVLGIYPLTRLFISYGVSRWHDEARKSFSTEPPADWKTMRYVPAKKFGLSSSGRIFEQTERDALGIPNFTAGNRQVLFRMYAPVWEIQFQGNYDRIGAPIYTDSGILSVDTARPATYTLLSFARFGAEIFTQLNYIIWFPSRPKEGVFDILGGNLDGVNYRVTLDNSGNPLVYETMHNCGCYYKAYPTDRLQVRAQIDYAEPPLILEAPDINPSIDLMAVAMESRTHYVQHLYPLSRKLMPGLTVYSLIDYGELRSLKYLANDRRSMFGQDSIAPGSQRLERFILWPTGVLSPGAMRQWGRHAVAFAGKRHFDDPFFMDRMFVKSASR